MSFLPYHLGQTIYLIFMRVDKPWYLKWLKGFNHVAIAWPTAEELVFIVEPVLNGTLADSRRNLDWLARRSGVVVVEVETGLWAENKLFKFTFQTCASLVQYLAGINLKVWLAQSLYDKLINLSVSQRTKYGIQKVTVWEAAAVQDS